MAVRFDDWESEFLSHHGIKGQKWGVRRFQNEDGSLTSAGKAHYGQSEGGSKTLSRQFNRSIKKLNRLEKKTDIDTQKQIAEKYSKRAKIGAGATAALAASTIRSQLKSALNNKEAYEGWRAEWNRADKASSEHLDWLFNHMGDKATAANDHVMGLVKEELSNMNTASRESAKLRDHTSFTTAGISTTTKILGAATVVAGGYTAYAAARSKIAKNRTTAEGHAKAVAKYQEQYSKIVNQFKNTPYSAIIPGNAMNKKKKSS